MSESLAHLDPHACAAPLAMHATVLGIRVTFATNEPAVLAAAAASFGGSEGERGVIGATVRVIVDQAAAPEDGPITHRLSRDHLVVMGGGCSGTVRPAMREATACVTRALLNDTDAFRAGVLEALTWGLLTRLDRQPLHAAALARNDAMLLLHGPSGAGKSTLALAASGAGLSAVADDIVFLQTRPHLRVWSAPGPLHVLPDAAESLGIDASQARARVRDGTLKLAVHQTALHGRAFERCGLVVLGPRSTHARVRRLSPGDALARIDLRRDPGFHVFADTIEPVLARLINGRAWLLETTADPRDSVPLLARLMLELNAAERPA